MCVSIGKPRVSLPLNAIGLAAAAVALLAAFAGPAAAVTVLAHFATGRTTSDGLGFDAATDKLYLSTESGVLTGNPQIYRYTRAGAYDGLTISGPGTNGAAEADVSFTTAAFTLGGTSVPAGSMLFLNSHVTPNSVVSAVDKNTGTAFASVATLAGHIFGGASYSAARGSIFAVSYNDSLIYEINPTTGATIATFDPGFNFNGAYCDVEVDGGGTVFLAAKSKLNEYTPTGALIVSYDLSALGISNVDGLALDLGRKEVWVVAGNAGDLYQLSGVAFVPEPATGGLAALALLALARRRRARG